MENDSALRISFWTKTLVLGTCLILAGCIDSKSGKSNDAAPAAPATPATPPPGGTIFAIPPSDTTEAARFLTQATFGPTLEAIETVRSMGYAAWIDRQMDPARTPPTTIIPYLELVDATKTDGGPISWDHRRENYWFWSTLTAEDQLRMRMAFALSQIFVVSKDAFRPNGYRHLADYYDTLSRGAFGSYRDLLEQVTLHPAMGHFLDHVNNAKADPENNIFPDQNYARESMQLFSIGLVELNPDGTPRLDDQGREIETYDEDLIAEFARVYTGWTFAGQGANNFGKESFASYAPMECVPAFHDDGPKALFDGQIVAAGSDCQATLDQALDILASHPNVAPFISRQLIQRLVTSNPSPQYIQRVSSVWTTTGGDLGQVLKAILLDSEARILSDDPHYGKVREPLIKLSAYMRAFGVLYMPLEDDPNSYLPRGHRFRNVFGQDMLSAPSVFNFYSPDYQPHGYLQDNGLVAPELQLLDEARVGATHLGMNGIYRAFAEEVPPATERNQGNLYIDLRALQAMADADDFEGIVERINLLLFSGNLEMDTQHLLLELFREMHSTPQGVNDPVAQAYRFVFFIPEFAIQR